MPEAQVIEWIRQKYHAMLPELDERGRRRWAAAELAIVGGGGDGLALATGMSDRTIRNGLQELESPETLPAGRQRREGGDGWLGSTNGEPLAEW